MSPKKIKKRRSKKSSKGKRQRRGSSSSSTSCSDGDTNEEAWNYNLHDMLTTEQFINPQFVTTDLNPKALNRAYFYEHGLEKPLHFQTPEHLGMKVPPPKFSVDNVKKCVGAKRMVEVVNVTTQQADFMPMAKFCSYFKKNATAPTAQKKKELFNVLSLEYSKTDLEKKVQAPRVVRDIDWVEQMWPKELKMKQECATNDSKRMFYPKVQNYCLMSVHGCYTDFHVDFGGTSVWYHLVKGAKTFWLVEPTEPNLAQFEEWLLSGTTQNNVFFGTLVKTHRVTLRPGNVFFIPSGWIHAVFTPEDSLVFGGNFLHQYAMPMQLRVFETEDNTRVKKKFRYPFFMEMHWYVLNYYSTKFTENEYIKQVETEELPPVLDPNAPLDNNLDTEEREEGVGPAEMPKIAVQPAPRDHRDEPRNGDGFPFPFEDDETPMNYEKPTKWNEAFLQKLSGREIEGLMKVTDWMHDMMEAGRQRYPRGLVRPKRLLADIRAGVEEAKRLQAGKTGLFDMIAAADSIDAEQTAKRQQDIEATIKSVCKRAAADSTTPDQKPFPCPLDHLFEPIPLGKMPLPSFLRKIKTTEATGSEKKIPRHRDNVPSPVNLHARRGGGSEERTYNDTAFIRKNNADTQRDRPHTSGYGQFRPIPPKQARPANPGPAHPGPAQPGPYEPVFGANTWRRPPARPPAAGRFDADYMHRPPPPHHGAPPYHQRLPHPPTQAFSPGFQRDRDPRTVDLQGQGQLRYSESHTRHRDSYDRRSHMDTRPEHMHDRGKPYDRPPGPSYSYTYDRHKDDYSKRVDTGQYSAPAPSYQQSATYYDPTDQHIPPQQPYKLGAQREVARRIGDEFKKILHEEEAKESYADRSRYRQSSGFVPPNAPKPYARSPAAHHSRMHDATAAQAHPPYTKMKAHQQVPPGSIAVYHQSNPSVPPQANVVQYRPDPSVPPRPNMVQYQPIAAAVECQPTPAVAVSVAQIAASPVSPRRRALLLRPDEPAMYTASWEHHKSPPASQVARVISPPVHKVEVKRVVSPPVQKVEVKRVVSPVPKVEVKRPVLESLLAEKVMPDADSSTISNLAKAVQSLIEIIPPEQYNEAQAQSSATGKAETTTDLDTSTYETGDDVASDMPTPTQDEPTDMDWLDALGGITQGLSALKDEHT